MTHEDLLAKIQSNVDFLKTQCYEGSLIGGFVVTDALRAVVELHKPQPDHCPCCPPVLCECAEVYPCPTIQTIEKELS